jgi:hypothetical protein
VIEESYWDGFYLCHHWTVDNLRFLIPVGVLHEKSKKSKGCVPVSPDNDMENALGGQKEKQFHVQVVPEEKPEEMVITISDDPDTFCVTCDRLVVFSVYSSFLHH